MLQYQRGDKYTGQWALDAKHGYGIYRWGSGEEYCGEYKEDKREGQGWYRWNHYDEYFGAFVNDMREGEGLLKEEGKCRESYTNRGNLYQSKKSMSDLLRVLRIFMSNYKLKIIILVTHEY